MLERTDFEKKQIVFFVPCEGDKISFLNDNLVIKTKDEKIKFQITCYRIFLLFVVGDTSITTKLISMSVKFGFSICLMNRGMKIYKFISSRLEGNTHLRKLQYNFNGDELAQYIVLNKIANQKSALEKIRKKDVAMREAIDKLKEHLTCLTNCSYKGESLLGVEGSASRVYFPQMFNNLNWKGRKPRIKFDYVNSCLDIGYTILFNIIDALVNVYGFDEYKGILHTCFYMRKSLVCDLMEPFRPIIDYQTRKAINLGTFQESDFTIDKSKRFVLEWRKNGNYVNTYLESILERRNDIFLYIQRFYRSFMKNKPISEFPFFEY